ncbi:MAG: hypothetical protein AABW73_01515 [Nanoarchaeota archaeon]
MPKKSVMKIPKSYTLNCPLCHKNTRASTSIDFSPQKYTCPKCLKEILTPVNSCCIICANDIKTRRCPRNLYMEAVVKGLIIK